MSQYTLVVLETAQIQSYIFNSNRLKENIGASYLVAAATEDWVKEQVEEFAHNLKHQGFDENKRIEDGNLDVEILYCGGGNTVLLFNQCADAKTFIRKLSRKAIEQARGLRLTFHQQIFNWNQPLSHAVSDALKCLKSQRSHQPPSTGIEGLGVTAMCASTSLPAVIMVSDPDKNWEAISAEVNHKRKASDAANDKLEDALGFSYPLDFDDLGRTKGESSFIAVVHADGNDMGKLIQNLKTDYPTAQHNRAYIQKMRNFSENVKKASQKTLEIIGEQLITSVKDGVISGIGNIPDIKLKKDKHGNYILPFRPLVSGGDDITFVCDGRIGIDLAVKFLQAFEAQTEKILGTKLTACAGVAIVNSHYPFARAYELAEELCKSAKQKRHDSNHLDSSLIDWHYTSGGLYADLGTMREREYTAKNNKNLHMRPVFVTGQAEYIHTWDQLQRTTTHFQSKWSKSRGKAKGLMSALRDGDASAQAFKFRYLDKDAVLELPKVDSLEDGILWYDNHSVYYDALELMDLYFPVKEKQ